MTKWPVILCAAIALSAQLLPAEADVQTVHAQTSEVGRTSASASSSLSPSISLPIRYIGNAESHKFHRPSCPFARVMALNKQVQFNYRTQAVACGHIPCRYCLPPVWTVVRGRLLSPVKTPGSEFQSTPIPLGHPYPVELTQPHPPANIAPAASPNSAPVLRPDPPVDRAGDPP